MYITNKKTKMNSIKSDFCAPCFSGNCGLCRNCSARAMNYINPSEAPESIQRAHSLKLFMGERVNDALVTYNKAMNEFA